MTFVLLLLTAVAAKANPVDMRQAREVGAKFISANTAMRVAANQDLQWVTTYRTANNDAAFHVFNTPKGFVIVSADDCARPILGYSDEGHFDTSDVPVQMQEYLQGFVEQIQYGIDNHLVADEAIAREWELVQSTGLLSEERGTTAVQPLLTDTWNQNCYYNNLCPTDSDGPCGHVYVGCTGTAMGQIMHFWGYPTNGSGSMTYTPSGYPEQTANFGATTYQWSNMPNSLTSSSSSTQINAVATLLWHCGVALQASYGPNGTSAYPAWVPNVLTTYFGYSSDLYGANRSDYTDEAWLSMVKGCLDMGRPIHYSGWNSSGGGGHSFVCDGYDANDYLHFNWGWSGYYNNYFALGALTPGGNDFSYSNFAVINIHPNCAPGTAYQVTTTASPSNGGTVTGGGTYDCGTDCTVTATPADGYMFCSWTENGVQVSTETTYSFTVMDNRNLVANFSYVGGDACTLVFTLVDSYGDGWNGNALTVSYSTGCTTTEQLTLESGASGTFTRNVVDGSHIVLGFVEGSWAYECSFSITYADGTMIYQGSGLSSSFSYEFDVNCGATPPVDDYLTYSINSDGVSVTVTGHVNGTSATGPLDIPATTTINGTTYAVTAIANGAFQHYHGLTSVTFGNTLTSIATLAFWDCPNIAAVYYTGTIADWCNISFGDYESNPIKDADGLYIGGTLVTNLVIPEGVTNVKKYTFAQYEALSSVSFPSSLNIIGQCAFTDCLGLTSIEIPSAVYSIGNYAFSGCEELEQIVVQSGNAYYDSRNNCNAIIITNSNELLTGCMNTVVPSTVTSISNGAFAGCTGLTGEFIVPDAVTYIGLQAFQGCENLSSVVIGNGVTYMGNSAFNSCVSLTSVTIGNGLTDLGGYVFANCTSIASFQIDCETPPSASSYDFFDVDKSIPLTVPCGKSGAYSNATGWGEFTNIQENCSGISITATAYPTAGGIVRGAGQYSLGDLCTLTAIANVDYSFVNWTKNGSQVSTNATYSFTVNESGDYVANFEYTGEPPTAGILLEEHFDGSSLPDGWYISDYGTSNWSISTTNNAGGTANEVRLNWSPQFNGISRLVMPTVDLTGISSVGFSFKHALDNYSGTNTIGVATSSDNGVTWHDAWSQGFSTDVTSSVNEILSTADMGQPSVRFCIYYTGNSYNIDDWYFDDIQIFTLANLDLGVTAINLPDYMGAGTETVSFEVFNYGITTVTSLQATYELDGESVTQSFSVNIPTMGSTTLSFNTPVSLLPGSHELTVSLNSVNGTTDDNSLNDELTKAVAVALGVVERIPMIEHFSSSTCGPCVNVNTIMLNFCNNNPGRFTYTKYQMNWPGSGDPYYTSEGGTRRIYYNVNAVPNVILDGENYSTSMSQSDFDEEAEIPALMDIRGSFTVSGNTINVKADVMPYVDADARVYISVNEKVTTGNVGTNGETEFHHIFMKMLPDAQGTEVSLTASTLQHLEYSCNLSSTHVEEMSDLEVAIWVQNYGSREVFNSRFAYEYTNVHPNPVQNLSLTGVGGVFTATWNAPSQGNPTGYRVYVNGEVAVESTTNLSYSFNGTDDYYSVGVQALYGSDKTSVVVYVGCSNEPGTSYVIQAVANQANGGTVSGEGTYFEGQNCTLTATANEGYEFVNWTKNNEVVSTNATYSFTVTEDASFVAHFASTTHYWIYNPYQYSDNMNVVGMVAINGEVLESEYIEVGAFCGDECRGSDFVMQVEGQYIALMTIGGVNGDVITFRAYDHLAGREIAGTCEFTAVFETNALIGMDEPVVFNFVTAEVTQTTNFVNGWTWWSTYIDVEADVLGQLKDGLGASGQVIKSQTQSTMHLGNNWVGTLALSNEYGFMVKATSEVSVDITGPGVTPEEHPITLNPGWTWIGYPGTEAMPVAEALANHTPQPNDVIKGQSSSAMFMMGQWRGSLTITPGMGLMYKSNSSAPVTLTYATPGRMTEIEDNTTEAHWNANYSAYPTNMTVLAVVELDGMELNSENYELAAFANGECRGSVQMMYVEPINRYMALLTISGEEAAELHFALYDAETGEEYLNADEVLNFEADAIVGDVDAPFVIRFRGTTGVDELAKSLQVYPNPVAPGEMFSVGSLTAEGSEVRVEIVNALGAKVSDQTSTRLPATMKAPATAGVYMLKITIDGKETHCRKLVVR
jgi:hypothetical protein